MPDTSMVANRSSFSYNAAGQLVSWESRSPPSKPKPDRVDFIYDGQGRLVERRDTRNFGHPDAYILEQMDYTLRDTPMPSSWGETMLLAELISFTDYHAYYNWLWDVVSIGRHLRGWNSGGNLTNSRKYETSNPQYDDRGLLVRQVVTETNVLTDGKTVYQMQYEYTE